MSKQVLSILDACLCTLLALGLLAGCGQKGPLYLPPPAAKATPAAAPVSAAASASAPLTPASR